MTEANAPMHSMKRPFRLIAMRDRVLAQNTDGKIIDIGSLTHDGQDAQRGYAIRLDVDAIATEPQPDAESALRALTPLLTFDYLDGLFTSVVEVHPQGLLDDYPSIRIVLDEPAPPLTGSADDTPHRF